DPGPGRSVAETLQGILRVCAAPPHLEGSEPEPACSSGCSPDSPSQTACQSLVAPHLVSRPMPPRSATNPASALHPPGQSVPQSCQIQTSYPPGSDPSILHAGPPSHRWPGLAGEALQPLLNPPCSPRRQTRCSRHACHPGSSSMV